MNHQHRGRRRISRRRLSRIETLESRRLLVAEPDLVQFAKDLDTAGVDFYCAAWFEGCTAQTQIFADGGKYLPFTEVTGSDRQINQAGIDAMIGDIPAWDFPDPTLPDPVRHEGFLDLDQISQMSGVPIPMGETPSFHELDQQTVLIGSPLHVPIDAYDPDGNELTVSVTVDDPSLLEATVLTGNRSIRIDMAGFGDMVFQLYEQRAPRPAGRVADLAESGFYDGLTFHRVVDDFVLQGGDPNGNGTGGSSLDDFDDQFHPDLQHNQNGVLSFAKSGDDTNNSQFFITEGTTRHLDFNHSIFGQLVEGEEVREAISEIDTSGFPQNLPDFPVVMTTIDVFEDTENAIVFLRAIGDQPASTSVTIRVTDSDGFFSEQTVPVTIEPDTSNSQPFLAEIESPQTFFSNTTIEIQLEGIDVENDPVQYAIVFAQGDFNAGVDLDEDTGLITITPEADEMGAATLAVCTFAPGSACLSPADEAMTSNPPPFDRQFIDIEVVMPPALHRVDSPNDVNGDGELTTSDAFAVINTLSRAGGEIELGSAEAEALNPEIRVNVVPDQRISALDALVVINALQRDGIGGGESERERANRFGAAPLRDAVFQRIGWLTDDDKEEDEWLQYPVHGHIG